MCPAAILKKKGPLSLKKKRQDSKPVFLFYPWPNASPCGLNYANVDFLSIATHNQEEALAR